MNHEADEKCFVFFLLVSSWCTLYLFRVALTFAAFVFFAHSSSSSFSLVLSSSPSFFGSLGVVRCLLLFFFPCSIYSLSSSLLPEE
jgi:hypothetical protein